MLTEKQHMLHAFICERMAATGVAPSFEEMREEIGVASKATVARLVGQLEDRGYVRRLSHRVRAIEALRYPDGTPTASSAAASERLAAAAEAVTVHGASLSHLSDALARYRSFAPMSTDDADDADDADEDVANGDGEPTSQTTSIPDRPDA